MQPPHEAIVVGTIHGRHLNSEDYPLHYFYQLIHSYKPDLVLVEIRPEQFQKGLYGDGPVEMALITRIAQGLKIDVMPIDWWKEDESLLSEPRFDNEESHNTYERELLEIENKYPMPISFENTNGGEWSKVTLDKLNLIYRYCGSSDVWNQRQSWMHYYSKLAIEQKKPNRVMAFVGAQHKPELEIFIRTLGYSISSPLDIKIDRNYNFKIPNEAIADWRTYNDYLREKLKTASDPFKRLYQDKFDLFEKAVNLSHSIHK